MGDDWPEDVPEAPTVSATVGIQLLEQQIESARDLFGGQEPVPWEVRRAWEDETETCIEIAFGRGTRPAQRIVFAICLGTRRRARVDQSSGPDSAPVGHGSGDRCQENLGGLRWLSVEGGRPT